MERVRAIDSTGEVVSDDVYEYDEAFCIKCNRHLRDWTVGDGDIIKWTECCGLKYEVYEVKQPF